METEIFPWAEEIVSRSIGLMQLYNWFIFKLRYQVLH